MKHITETHLNGIPAVTAQVSGEVLTWNGTNWVNQADSNWKLNGNTVGSLKWLGTIDNFDLPFRTNNTEKVRIDVSGNIGQGTTTPSHFFDSVKSQDDVTTINITNSNAGTSASSRFRLFNGTSNTVLQHFGSSYTTSGINFQNGTLLQAGGAGGLSIASTNAGGEVRFYTGGTIQRVTLTSTGRLGIGTTSPSSLLHLIATTEQLRIGYDSNFYWTATTGATGTTTFGTGSTGTQSFKFNKPVTVTGIGTSTDYNFFTTNSSGTKIIKSRDDGYVGIGTNDSYLYAHFTVEGQGTTDYYYHTKQGDVKFYSGYNVLGGTYGLLDASGNVICRINSDLSTYDFLTTGRNYGLGTTDASAGKFCVNTTGHGNQITWQAAGDVSGYLYTTALIGAGLSMNYQTGGSTYSKVMFNGSGSYDWITTDKTLVIGSTPAVNVTPTGNTNALVDLQSTTKAFLLMRMTTTQRDAITAVNGMLIYNTTTNKFQGYAAGAWTDLH